MNMSRVCSICGRKTSFGNKYARRGLAKAKGGVGRRITGKNHRTFKPNIQKVHVKVDGTAMRVKLCTRCLRKGKLAKTA
jgi:large subunit ribosomal protein L28